jgi:phage shock protein A
VPESIFMRVRRVLSASVEEAVAALERASGASLMRETIRQVAEAAGEVRAEQEANAGRIADARRQQAQIRARIAELDGKAHYAIGREREDLAGAAVAKQLELEAGLARLDRVQAEAAEQALRLDECAAALAARQAQMERELAAFEASRPAGGLGGATPTRRDRKLKDKVGRAQETFDRVMASSGGAAAGRADPHEAEIDALQREETVEARLAAMRAAQAKRAARPKRKAG